MGRAVRLRQLTTGQTRRLEALRQIARLLDSAFLVPGTGYRIGLDPILGLIPGLGDLASPLFSMAVLWQARDVGVPKVVQLRMIFNVAIDTIVGVIPLAGDLFDFVWKSNDKNLALLDRYAYEEHRASSGDWLFVIVAMALLALLAAVPFVVLGVVIGMTRRLFA